MRISVTSSVAPRNRNALLIAMTLFLSSCELFTSPKQSLVWFGPTAVAGGHTFSSLVGGDGHTCGLTMPDAKAYCWGLSSTPSHTGLGDIPTGQLGDSLSSDAPEPVRVARNFSYVKLTAGAYHTCGLIADGTAYCWGANRNEIVATSITTYPTGQIGDGTSNHRFYPVAVAGGLTFGTISAGWFHTCALTAGGAAYCWGSGGLGVGDTVTRLEPTAVIGGLTFQSISSGGTHTCALTGGGAAYCWGNNSFGQLGDSTTVFKLSPALVKGGLTFQSIVASGNNTCGTLANGNVYCWGDNALGAVGDGTFSSRSAPTKVTTSAGLSGVVMGSLTASLFTGSGHACALMAAGKATCWGNNNSGQVGDGSTFSRPQPTAVVTALSFTALAGGGLHSCGLVASGAAYCWGNRFVLGTSTP